MKYTEEEIGRIIRENQILKDKLSAAERGLETRNNLVEVMVEGTDNIVVLSQGGSRRAEYVSSNVEQALGVAPSAVMEDICELGPSCGGPAEAESVPEGETRRAEVECLDRRNGSMRRYHRSTTRLLGGGDYYLSVFLDAEGSTADGGRLRQILQEGDSAVSRQYLAAMSHDLRTPLNSITGSLLLLTKNAQDPAKVLDYAHRIGMSCQNLVSTVSQIVDMNGVENGKIILEHEEFALGLAIEEVASLIGSQAQLKQQKFSVHTSGIEHDLFVGDKARINEILMNLLSNSVKYTAKGGEISLSVTGKPDTEPGYMDLSFEIKDNGIGMSSELQKRLFDSVGRSEDIPGMRGTGVGILMTRKLVSLMNGTLSVQSTPGQGTVFYVGLRLEAVDKGTDVFWDEHGIHRMLIVGESMNEASRICVLLESTGLKADYTSSGQGALQMVEQANLEDQSYDLILLDRDVQDMSYTEIASGIRSMSWISAPSIILMSDKADHFLRPVRKSGIASIMPKPFFFSTFRQMVEKLNIGNGVKSTTAGYENPLSGLRFLVAEDNTINADIMKELLEVEGARCEIAGNGKAAVAMFRNSKLHYYDMILMDIQMPIMNGYDATKEIRNLPRADAAQVPILAMTANTMAEDVRESFDSGMDAHITKPLDINLLNQTVRDLRSRRAGGNMAQRK